MTSADAAHEVLLEGLDHPEGPAVRDDGSVVFVETRRSRVSIWHADRTPGILAVTGGSPNACAVGDDGVYVTQSGGGFGGWEPRQPARPSIQRVAPDGSVDTVVVEVDGRPLRAPNDLCFGLDGRLYFTDPGRSFVDPENGAVYGLGSDGSVVTIEVGPTFPNGVVALADGAIAWVESFTRRVVRREPDGVVRHVATLPAGHVPDGLAAADDGTLVVATMGSGGLDLVAADGRLLGVVPVGGRPLNCAFVGRSLVVACDPGEDQPPDAGRLVRVPTQLRPGPIHRGSV